MGGELSLFSKKSTPFPSYIRSLEYSEEERSEFWEHEREKWVRCWENQSEFQRDRFLGKESEFGKSNRVEKAIKIWETIENDWEAEVNKDSKVWFDRVGVEASIHYSMWSCCNYFFLQTFNLLCILDFFEKPQTEVLFAVLISLIWLWANFHHVCAPSCEGFLVIVVTWVEVGF